jgi:hypothetical protein
MGGLFGGKPAAPPEPKDPAPMPDEHDPKILEAKRRALLAATARGGRQSTILTTPETRGSNDYSRTTLGGR